MKKTKRIFIFSIAALLICLICFFIGKSIGNSQGKTEIDAVVLEGKLTEISQLSTVTYAYTNMAEFENAKDFYGITVPFTTKGFIITYDGEINAGIDLTQAQIEVTGKKIHIKLPEAEILSHEIDEESLEVFDETTSIFNPLKIKDYSNFNKDQKKAMEAKAKEKGILTQAKEKAVLSIENLIGQIAGQAYTIRVE